MKDFFDFVIRIGLITLVVLIFALFTHLAHDIKPVDMVPGDEIRIISTTTVMYEGKPCQENQAGFISPTGPKAEDYWYKPNDSLYASHTEVAVISPDGTIEWIDLDKLVKSSAVTPELLLCPASSSE